MKKKIIICLSLFFLTCSLQAAPMHLTKIQLNSSDNTTELQCDFSAEPRQSLMALKDPERLILDFENVLLKTNLPALSSSSFYIKKISTVKQKTSKVRLVLDLKEPITYKTSLKKIGKQEKVKVIIYWITYMIRRSTIHHLCL